MCGMTGTGLVWMREGSKLEEEEEMEEDQVGEKVYQSWKKKGLSRVLRVVANQR